MNDYIMAGDCRYHISANPDGTVVVRLVDAGNRGTPPLWVHMRAGNLVEIKPDDAALEGKG